MPAPPEEKKSNPKTNSNPISEELREIEQELGIITRLNILFIPTLPVKAELRLVVRKRLYI